MLTTIKQLLIWTCAYPAPDFTTKREKIRHVALASVLFVALLLQLICYIISFLKLLSDDIIGLLH